MLTDTFVPSRYELENSTTAEAKLLHLQPSINSHFNFLLVKLATFQVLLQWPKISSSMRAALTSVPHVLCQLCDNHHLSVLNYF
jgi:hypothetical protein